MSRHQLKEKDLVGLVSVDQLIAWVAPHEDDEDGVDLYGMVDQKCSSWLRHGFVIFDSFTFFYRISSEMMKG